MKIPLIVFAVLISQLAVPIGALRAERTFCIGKYKGGLKPSREELTDILKKYEGWLKTPPPTGRYDFSDPRRANLCEADLRGTNLGDANLEYANLEYANLTEANLKGADLTRANLTSAQLPIANLTRASLIRANLMSANLFDANLEYANFEYTNLEYATLTEADLKGTDLTSANLTNANLTKAKLEGTDFNGANVERADFDLLPDSLPEPVALSSAEGLQFVQFTEQPAGLVKLRSEFKDLGLRIQESQLTYAIRRSELRRREHGAPLHGPGEQWVNYVFFDLTCQYGMSPERPLIIVAFLVILFSVIYVFAQIFPAERAGIWVVWEEHRIGKTEGGDAPQRLTAGFPSARARGRVRCFCSSLLLALYFSLLSALRIGWSGLNFGTWISRMQPREYELHATGWVRVVSGVQSLISVYLVALTILTYFGTPFEY